MEENYGRSWKIMEENYGRSWKIIMEGENYQLRSESFTCEDCVTASSSESGFKPGGLRCQLKDGTLHRGGSRNFLKGGVAGNF